MIGSAAEFCSLSRVIRRRSTPCVEGCCGPMLSVMSSVARALTPAPTPTMRSVLTTTIVPRRGLAECRPVEVDLSALSFSLSDGGKPGPPRGPGRRERAVASLGPSLTPSDHVIDHAIDRDRHSERGAASPLRHQGRSAHARCPMNAGDPYPVPGEPQDMPPGSPRLLPHGTPPMPQPCPLPPAPAPSGPSSPSPVPIGGRAEQAFDPPSGMTWARVSPRHTRHRRNDVEQWALQHTIKGAFD